MPSLLRPQCLAFLPQYHRWHHSQSPIPALRCSHFLISSVLQETASISSSIKQTAAGYGQITLPSHRRNAPPNNFHLHQGSPALSTGPVCQDIRFDLFYQTCQILWIIAVRQRGGRLCSALRSLHFSYDAVQKVWATKGTNNNGLMRATAEDLMSTHWTYSK